MKNVVVYLHHVSFETYFPAGVLKSLLLAPRRKNGHGAGSKAKK